MDIWFKTGVNTDLFSDMRKPKLMAEIAKQLRRFHEVEIPGSREPQLWNDISKFFSRALTLKFDDSEKQKKYEMVSFEEINKEINGLKVAMADRFNAPVVYCHNDLLSGNLMLNENEGKLYFIDFEYGSYSYRGFDLGNHFNEYAGSTTVITICIYPSQDEQFNFFRHYLKPDTPHEAKMSPINFDYLSYFFLRYNEHKKQEEKCFSLAQSYFQSR
ncbi:hypothetical protein SASPL_138477 [Salvia splendens]|uniref:ethanolamine kinase n=1 Tax=Salvia splendens TaxID=180675 RepID=A0A8X8WX00_SALSN|nr:hypothetical protein SASPL_138477 [Salvia splendens]